MKSELEHPFDRAVESFALRVLELYRQDEELRRSMREVLQSAADTMLDSFESTDEETDSDGEMEEGEGKAEGEAAAGEAAPSFTAPEDKPAPQVQRPSPATPVQDKRATLVYSTDPGERQGLTQLGQGLGGIEEESEPTVGQMETISDALAVKAETSALILDLFHEGLESPLDDSGAYAEQERLIEKARTLGNCYLWMLRHARPRPETAADWALLVHNFETAAYAASVLARQCDADNLDGDGWKELLTYCAQAQSALRANVSRTGQQFDLHQLEFFKWIRRFAKQRQHYIERYMREEDVASPEKWADLREAIESFDRRTHARFSEQRERKNLEGKIRYHVQQLERSTGEQKLEEWRKIMAAADGLVRLGVPPSDVSLREPLLPHVDEIPEMDEEPHGFGLVLREIDTYLSRFSVEPTGPAVEDAPSQEVQQVRELLAGKTVVLIGGEPRNAAKQALEEAFGLAELDWILGKHHQSVLDFRPNIVRDETVLVLLAIRWSSHSFSEVKAFCDEADKALVRLPGGYNPNQVAHQILQQAGEVLRKAINP